jgi:hypothetical protein
LRSSWSRFVAPISPLSTPGRPSTQASATSVAVAPSASGFRPLPPALGSPGRALNENLVATTEASRQPASARNSPSQRSLSPADYMSAVSKKLPPRSR